MRPYKILTTIALIASSVPCALPAMAQQAQSGSDHCKDQYHSSILSNPHVQICYSPRLDGDLYLYATVSADSYGPERFVSVATQSSVTTIKILSDGKHFIQMIDDRYQDQVITQWGDSSLLELYSADLYTVIQSFESWQARR